MPTHLHQAKEHERFEHLFNLMKSEPFLKMQGLGNEVPFYICPYPPEDANMMVQLQQHLAKQLANQSIKVLQLSLYDIICDIMRREGDWDYYIEHETERDKADLKDDLQSILDVEKAVTPEINARMQATSFDILFLSGVGEVFPYIRSHNVLNNLQRFAKEHPTVLFFPGQYVHSAERGASLELFGKLHDDKYYRAFNIYSCEP